MASNLGAKPVDTVGYQKMASPPTFQHWSFTGEGTQDPAEWIDKLNVMFKKFVHPDDSSKIDTAATFMDKSAMRWYLTCEKSSGFKSWSDFEHQFRQIYCPEDQSRCINELFSCKQRDDESVQTYTTRMQMLHYRAGVLMGAT